MNTSSDDDAAAEHTRPRSGGDKRPPPPAPPGLSGLPSSNPWPSRAVAKEAGSWMPWPAATRCRCGECVPVPQDVEPTEWAREAPLEAPPGAKASTISSSSICGRVKG